MTYRPIPGQVHNPSDEETMSVIRSVLTETDEPAQSRKASRAERKAQARAEAPAAAPVAPFTKTAQPTEKPVRAFVERTLVGNPRRRAGDLPDVQDAAAKDTSGAGKLRLFKLGAIARRHVGALLANMRNFRPSTRHLALVSMALLVALRPHWFVISGVLIVALFVATFLILGSDRIWRMVVAGLANLEARNPERAHRMRGRLDRFACRWDAILDFFPDGMVDGLYMPDLQAMQDADTAHADAMATRLNQMARDS